MIFATESFELAEAQVSARGAKTCTLSGKDGKVLFKLGGNREPVSTPFGATTFNEEPTTRKTIDFRLTEAQAEEFQALDAWAHAYLEANSERLFKKKLTASQIAEHYRSPVSRKEGYAPLLRCKINTAGKNAVRVWDEDNERTSLPEDLRLFELVPRIQLSHMWVMGRDFGFVLNVQDLKVLNGAADAPCPYTED